VTRRRGLDDGQAMVEFALIAPILFLLLFAVIQLGLLFGAQNGLVNAVRDSTRRAATYRVNDASFDTTTFNGICAALRTELDGRLQREIPGFTVANRTSTITYEWKSNNETTGTTYFLVAHIRVQYSHPLYVPLVSLILDGMDGSTDGALRLDANEQMRIENPDIVASGSNQTCS
jgi:Flp pilus assembly protein TadG